MSYNHYILIIVFLCVKGISPDVVTYSTLMKAFLWAKKFDQVYYIYICLKTNAH